MGGIMKRFEHARLIDGTGNRPQDDATVIVDGSGRIAYAGPAGGAPATPDASTVDLSSMTILPGFIDAHVHFLFGPKPSGPPADSALTSFHVARRMRDTLAAGITSARDLGGLSAGYCLAQESGLIEAPRLLSAGRIIGHTGGHCDATGPDGHNATGHFTILADDEQSARVAVRTVLREGADVIKICATGGMGSPHDDPDDEDLSEAEIRAVVDEARRHRGKKVAAHAQGTAGILNALRGGVASIEHGYGVTDEACDLALASGTFLVPTLATAFNPLDPSKVSPLHFEKKSRWAERTRENIALAISRGVAIAMGTDAGVSPHAANLLELAYLVQLGMTELQAITAGTLNGARLLGIDDVVGTVEVGKIADLVITDADPLTDIAALARPEHVRMVLQSGIARRNTLPARASVNA
ncbi:amidohydrolase family protein [Pseudarthrobacter sp. lyk4-40-TYG-27]|uniref:metal-dependent hydrolase family protein n=1 Tax=Pseudarthrobacter sp. lyk4-40-TYG-27 TaxID=3040305 RepID=UPI002556A4CC|nr:amidohydrolase family protein [Pseudarthrobacter sp. lyk4-40-TYG-27]